MNDDRPLPPSTRIIYAVFDAVWRYDKTRLLSGIAVLVIAAVLASGFYIIKKEEQGVRLRFGKVVEAVVEPGVNYRLPFIEKVHIRKVKRIISLLDQWRVRDGSPDHAVGRHQSVGDEYQPSVPD